MSLLHKKDTLNRSILTSNDVYHTFEIMGIYFIREEKDVIQEHFGIRFDEINYENFISAVIPDIKNTSTLGLNNTSSGINTTGNNPLTLNTISPIGISNNTFGINNNPLSINNNAFGISVSNNNPLSLNNNPLSVNNIPSSINNNTIGINNYNTQGTYSTNINPLSINNNAFGITSYNTQGISDSNQYGINNNNNNVKNSADSNYTQLNTIKDKLTNLFIQKYWHGISRESYYSVQSRIKGNF